MTVEITTLPSGIRVVTEEMAGMRSAALGMWVGVGSRDELPGQQGCSHFLEHLLFKGTSKRSARDIAEALDAVGGEMNAFTSKELTCFYARTLDRDVPLAADVLGDMLREATNSDEDVEAERQVVLEEINIHFDSPDDLVHSDLAEVVLGDHTLALETLGSIESITGMARDTVHGYYLDHYRPANLVVAGAGNLDHAQVLALVDEHLGDLGRPSGAAPQRSAPVEFGQGRVHVRHRPTEQAHVAFGAPGMSMHDDRRYAFRVLHTLLGGGMSSRLFQEVREVRGLAYTTYSYSSQHVDTGYWGAYAGTNPAKVDELCDVLRSELERVAIDVTADEVDRAKGQLSGGTVMSLEDPGSRMMRLGNRVANGMDVDSVSQILARIDAVDLDAVREIAAETLGRRLNLAVVGPFDASDTDRFAQWVAA